MIHQARQDNNFDDLSLFHEKKLAAFKTFRELGDLEGQADVYFSWAIALILNPNVSTGQRDSANQPVTSFDPTLRRDRESQSLTDDIDIQRLLRGHDEIMLTNPTVVECLDEALGLYYKYETDSGKKVSFNIAKCLYEKALWLTDYKPGRQNQIPQSRSLYFKNCKKEILDTVAEIKTRVKEYQHFAKSQRNRHKGTVNTSYVQHFYARCNLIKAKVF